MKRLHHMLRAAAGAYSPPVATDPQFPYVSLLLNDTGTNGQQNNTFLDSSTNNFTITRNGTPTQGSVTPYLPDGQWSNYFTGSSQSLSLADNAAFNLSSGSFTVEAWVFAGGFPNDPSVVIQKGWSPGVTYPDWGISFPSVGGIRKLRGVLGDGSTSEQAITGSTTVVANTWYHVAFTSDGTTLRLFLNGILEASATRTVATGNSTRVLAIAAANNGSNFQGYISNIRVVKGTALYTSNFTPSTTPLTAVSGTSLLTCQSNRFKDNSSNNFAITVNGTPQVTAFDPFSPAASYSTGTYGGSGYFNGSTDSINTPTSAAVLGTNNWTFECWVYLNAKPSFGQVLGMRKGVSTSADQYAPVVIAITSTGFALYSSSNSTSWDVANGVAFGGTASVSQWYHVAVVRNGSAIYGYVNGVQTTLVASTSANYTSTNSIFAGGAQASDRVNCYISNARVVNGTAVYTANFTPPTAPVTAITNTSLLLNFTNAGIYDAATLNDLVTVGDAKVSTAQAKWGSSSMAFDGTGDWLTFPDSSTAQLGSGDFTIEGWVYLSTIGTAKYIAAKGTSTTGWAFGINSSNQLVFNYTSSTLTGATALSSGQWYYVAVVRSGTATGNVKIYLSGAADATSSGAITDNFNQTNAGYIGADRTGANPMNGYIDDLRITKGYARAISTPTAPFPTR